jgi:hypothetical protein
MSQRFQPFVCYHGHETSLKDIEALSVLDRCDVRVHVESHDGSLLIQEHFMRSFGHIPNTLQE